MSQTTAIRWGFLGAGRMATALGRGLVASEVATGAGLIAYDPMPAALSHWTEVTRGRSASSAVEVVEASDVVIVAVKPSVVAASLGEAAPAFQVARQLLISIAAGVSLAAIEARLPSGAAVVRSMPNTPALLGVGATAFAAGRHVDASRLEWARRCFESVGIVRIVPEALLDAVTGLSGSGPAFVYLMIEAMADGGVRMGLPREDAQALAAQTVLGAARMVLETGRHPGQLKDEVTSPGGTTIAGVHALERAGLRGALIDAVEAATLRSRQLGSAS